MIRSILIKVFALFILMQSTRGYSTEYQPWLGNICEFELRSSLLYQDYTWLSSNSHLKKHASNDFFLNVSLINTIPQVGFEIEAVTASTKKQNGDFDHLKATGRYVWYDDIAGDPVSLTGGLSLIYDSPKALRDVSSFHHGRGEGEFFLSLGKENPEETIWRSRWWGMAGIGIADRGSSWLRFQLSYEARLGQENEIKLFLHSLFGCGHKKLRVNHFRGYGDIEHHSIDVGVRYTRLLQFFGNASLEYSYRLYARNYPVYTHQVMAQILYTFGI